MCDESNLKYYGCGLVYPEAIEGQKVLDLGCGAGRDVFVLSQLVGENGSVVGVDFSQDQLSVGQRHIDWHMRKFNYTRTNVEFILSDIADLSAIRDSSIDVVVSNCVINLATNKRKVMSEVFRVLKPGGEFYFSDVYSTRRMPRALKDSVELWGECISGALYWNDFMRLSKEQGFLDPRLVKSNVLSIANRQIEEQLGQVGCFSATYRLFKIPSLEPDCEDYGQAVIYKGTITGHPHSFDLDGHHCIETNKVFAVCGNTLKMLFETRFREHFTFIGDYSVHFGIFDGCGKTMPFIANDASNSKVGGSCC